MTRRVKIDPKRCGKCGKRFEEHAGILRCFNCGNVPEITGRVFLDGRPSVPTRCTNPFGFAPGTRRVLPIFGRDDDA